MIICPTCQHPMPPEAAFCPKCGATELGDGATEYVADPVELSGTTVAANEAGSLFADRYEVEHQVGAGAMGVVHRAIDTLTKKTVALKLIHPNKTVNEQQIQRMIAEATTTRDIRHANIVAVYDVGQHQGVPFMSMEYIQGTSLKDWLSEKKRTGNLVNWRVAVKIVSELLAGLQAAHSAGVVHRDLKPDNVMLLAEPTETAAPLKILDFGIARAAETQTREAKFAGSFGYMPPEQINEADTVGPTADLYSLSVMFYEMLVGNIPGQSHWQPPSKGCAEVPKPLDDLIEQGTSNAIAQRPASATEYAERLEAACKPAGGFDWMSDGILGSLKEYQDKKKQEWADRRGWWIDQGRDMGLLSREWHPWCGMFTPKGTMILVVLVIVLAAMVEMIDPDPESDSLGSSNGSPAQTQSVAPVNFAGTNASPGSNNNQEFERRFIQQMQQQTETQQREILRMQRQMSQDSFLFQ